MLIAREWIYAFVKHKMQWVVRNLGACAVFSGFLSGWAARAGREAVAHPDLLMDFLSSIKVFFWKLRKSNVMFHLNGGIVSYQNAKKYTY